MKLRRGLIVVLAVFVGCIGAYAQQSREAFGKNRMQYRQFKWQYLTGENFDVYYYDGRSDIARQALEYIENEFDRVTDLIGYPPYFKTKVFLYSSLSDLRQSNVGLNQNTFRVGGETEFIKPYVEVAYVGTGQEFKEELLVKISGLMVNEMMYGGSLKDVFQNSLLLNLPDWFVDGAALYVANGWDGEMDDFVRELMRTRKSKNISRLTGHDAALAGQSVWNYIAEKYGKSSVSNILNYTRVTRNEEKSVMITLGISFKTLMSDWRKYYSDISEQVYQSYVTPSDSAQLTPSLNKSTAITAIKLSPDGRYLAYSQNDRGRYIVKVRSLETGKEKVILSGGSKVIDQRVDYSVPLIAWSDATTLGVIAVKQGKFVFWLYDLSTKTKLPRQLDRFSNVRSLSFSANGRLGILSGDFEGQNDLFLISTRRERVSRITNDVFDDLDPSFIPGTNRIVFSSNRISDTLNLKDNTKVGQLSSNYNLFVYDLDTTKNVVTRITNTLSKDFSPLAIDNYNYIYLSDQRGIVNLFKYNLNTGIYSQLTNYSTSIKRFDMVGYTLALVANKDMEEHIYLNPNFSTNRQIFTPATRRKELQQVRIIRERRKKEEEKSMSIKDLLNSRLKESKEVERDTVVVPVDSLATPNTELQPIDSTATVNIKELTEKKQQVNTDDYVFEDEVEAPRAQESFLTRYMKAREKSKILGPFPYEPKFSSNSLITSFVVDPLRGFGISLETQMNDMLENYRFYGGLMTTLDLRNGDVYAEIQYLPAYIDFSVRFDRRSVRKAFYNPNIADKDELTEYQFVLNKFEVGASMPLNDRIRVMLRPFFEMARSSSYGSANYPITPPSDIPKVDYYTGFNAELVYDNSVYTGLNAIEGTRGKIGLVHHYGLNNSNNSFSKAFIDLRHYQKIYKEIVFAVRGYAGSFFGNSPKLFLLGGMDNWLFNQTIETGATSTGQRNPVGPDANPNNQDLLFAEFATNLRGFDYATLFGNNVLLLNAELRLPLIRALTNEPITSNFFRNMQIIGFYDIGTSWSGKPPFTDGTSVSYNVIEQNPFTAQINNYLNPWLYSYGVGLRTVMLGYYMKFDLAWPVENFEVQDPRFMFTLGFDF